MLCLSDHVPMENRVGLIAREDLTRAMGHAGRRAAIGMVRRHSSGAAGRPKRGAGRGFDAAECVAELCHARVTPQVARRSGY